MNENIITIFVGEKGAGTTTLIESMLGRYDQNKAPVSTQGVIYHNAVISEDVLQIVEVPKSKLLGTERVTKVIGRATEGNTLYIVLDATKRLPNAETFRKEWIDYLNQPQRDSKVKVNVIFNKIDLLSKEGQKILKEDVTNLFNDSQIEGFILPENIFYCSGKTIEGLTKLMQHIVSNVKEETSRPVNIVKRLWNGFSNFVSEDPIRWIVTGMLIVATVAMIILSIVFPPVFAFITAATLYGGTTFAVGVTPILIGVIGIMAIILWNLACSGIEMLFPPKTSEPEIKTDHPLQPLKKAPEDNKDPAFKEVLQQQPKTTKTSDTTKPNLSPVMVYEIKPIPKEPQFNVKLVVWSNVKALGEDFLKSPEFRAQLERIQQEQQPNVILLDNIGEKMDLNLDGLKTQACSSGGGTRSLFIYKNSYDFRMHASNWQGSGREEGGYYWDDGSPPLSFRFIYSEIKPNNSKPNKSVEDARNELISELYSTTPKHNYATPQGDRPDREGDHTIIILPKLVQSIEKGDNECDVFYKSFKTGAKEQITGQPLDPETGKVLDKGVVHTLG